MPQKINIEQASNIVCDGGKIFLTFYFLSQDSSNSGTFLKSKSSKSVKYISHEIDLKDFGLSPEVQNFKLPPNTFKNCKYYIENTIESFENSKYRNKVYKCCWVIYKEYFDHSILADKLNYHYQLNILT